MKVHNLSAISLRPRVQPWLLAPAFEEGHAGPRATIILPAYNEALALPSVLSSLLEKLPAHCEILVVDDGSTDGTPAVAGRYPCRVVCHAQNRGKGVAVRTGVREARGRLVVVMDADSTYPAEAVPRILDLLEDHEIVHCPRIVEVSTMPLVNRIGNRLFDLLLKCIHNLKGTDHLSGLFGFQREAMQAMRLTARGFDLEAEISIKAHALGFRAATLPILYQPRLGEKKLRPIRHGWDIVRRIFSLGVLYRPEMTFLLPGALLLALALTLTLLLSRGAIVAGPHAELTESSLTIFVLGVALGLQCVLFAIVAASQARNVGVPPKLWLRILGCQRASSVLAYVGLLLAFGGTVSLGILVLFRGFGGSAPPLYPTLGLSGAALLLGIEQWLAAHFLSIFTDASNEDELSYYYIGPTTDDDSADAVVEHAAPALPLAGD